MLRVDYCSSSILFTGDAEVEEEKFVDVGGPITLLQVGHHGSNTSSGKAFVAKLAPRYAIISAGKPHDGLNKGYCHPRASSVKRLNEHLGGPGTKTLRAYGRDDKCDDTDDASWSRRARERPALGHRTRWRLGAGDDGRRGVCARDVGA